MKFGMGNGLVKYHGFGTPMLNGCYPAIAQIAKWLLICLILLQHQLTMWKLNAQSAILNSSISLDLLMVIQETLP